MRKKPDWVPDWHNESEYPDPATTTPQQWAWEFLRRDPQYQQKYAEFENKIESDILKQAEKEFITKETARIFIQCLKDHGKDCLIPIPSINLPVSQFAGVYEGEAEYKMLPPYPIVLDFLNDNNPIDEFINNGNKKIPMIREPACVKDIREFYDVKNPKNPANNTAPIFNDEINSPFVPIAVSHHSANYLNYLQPEIEDEIAFMVDLKKPIKEQISFIKKLCIELQIKTKNRTSKPKKIEWRRQLRLLDAIDYGPRTARKILAKEWCLQPNSLSKKLLTAQLYRDGGFRTIVSSGKPTLNSDPKSVALQIKLGRSLSKLTLNFDKDIDPNIRRREAEKIKQESLTKLRTKSKKQ